jgi:hypothetical protein
MEHPLQQQLPELLDKKACEEVLMRYGRTLDWLDHAGQEECFWPDAKIDYGFFQGSGKDWVPVVMELEIAETHRWHVSTGVMVQINGDKAKSECYGFTAGTMEDEQGNSVDTLFGGRYLDELEKREGQWRISQRTYIADWTHSFPSGLDDLSNSGFLLNILQIKEPNHASYRRL